MRHIILLLSVAVAMAFAACANPVPPSQQGTQLLAIAGGTSELHEIEPLCSLVDRSAFGGYVEVRGIEAFEGAFDELKGPNPPGHALVEVGVIDQWLGETHQELTIVVEGGAMVRADGSRVFQAYPVSATVGEKLILLAEPLPDFDWRADQYRMFRPTGKGYTNGEITVPATGLDDFREALRHATAEGAKPQHGREGVDDHDQPDAGSAD